MPKMNAQEIHRFLDEHFPQVQAFGTRIEEVLDGRLRLRLPFHDRSLRPGGTISGPTLMTLADTAMYFLILSMLGPVAGAVTTHLSIDFLRRPAPVDILADAEMLKLGSRLAVGRVLMHSVGDPLPIAHASLTYSIPPHAGQ